MGWVNKRTCPDTAQEALITAAATGEPAPAPSQSTDLNGNNCAAQQKDSFGCENLSGCMWAPCGCTALGDWTCSRGKQDTSQHPKPLTQWEYEHGQKALASDSAEVPETQWQHDHEAVVATDSADVLASQWQHDHADATDARGDKPNLVPRDPPAHALRAIGRASQTPSASSRDDGGGRNTLVLLAVLLLLVVVARTKRQRQPRWLGNSHAHYDEFAMSSRGKNSSSSSSYHQLLGGQQQSSTASMHDEL